MSDALATCEAQRVALDQDLTLALGVLSALLMIMGLTLYVMWVRQ